MAWAARRGRPAHRPGWGARSYPRPATRPRGRARERGAAAMIRVREEQLDEIARALALEHFEDDMIVHLRSYAQRHAEVIGEDGVRRTVQLAITRARAYDVTDTGAPPVLEIRADVHVRRDVRHRDLAPAVGGEILRDAGTPDQAARIDRLYDATVRYPSTPSTARTAPSPSAPCGRSSACSATATPVPRLCVEDEAVATDRAHPPGCAGVARRGARPRARPARPRGGGAARPRHGRGHRAGTHRADCSRWATASPDDPLYPWVQATLRDPAVKGPERRAARLRKRVEIYLDRALRYFDGRPADGQG